MRKAYYIILFVFFFCTALSQRDAKMDSILGLKIDYEEVIIALNQRFSVDFLEKVYRNEANEAVRLKIINALCWKYFSSNPQKALSYAKLEISLAEKLKSKDGIEMGYDNLGFLYDNVGEYEKSISFLLKSLKIKEENKDSSGIAVCMNGIGSVYFTMENFPKALEYMFRTLQIDSLLHNKGNIPTHYGNIGNCYANMNQFDLALKNYLIAEKEAKNLGQRIPTINLENTGTAYANKGDFVKAKEYLLNAQTSAEIDKDVSVIASINIDLGELFIRLKDYTNALKNAKKGLLLAKENKLIDMEIQALRTIADISSKTGKFENAYDYHLQYSNLKDTLLTEMNSRAITEMNTKYDTEKKEKQIEIQNLTLTQQDLELNKKQIIIYSTAGGIALLVLLSFFIFRGYRQKQKANIELTDKNIIIAEKSKIVEEQHKDITDSIKYAERIQKAILPPDKFWHELLPNSFVLYKPKDILSGDFYFIEQNEEYVYVAAADCTGHGVPGALMSLVNYNLLNKAVLEKNIVNPSEILDEVNKSLTVSLHQTYNESAVRDGMDIALCAIHKKSISPSGGGVRSGRTGEVLLQFAGAFNGGYIFKKDGSFTDLNGDKKPVGAFIEEKISLFTNFSQVLEKGDKVLIFSDGFADQFGGPKGKKLKYKNLQQYIAESLHLEMPEQKKYLGQKFDEWKSNFEQVDDVLVIGFTI